MLRRMTTAEPLALSVRPQVARPSYAALSEPMQGYWHQFWRPSAMAAADLVVALDSRPLGTRLAGLHDHLREELAHRGPYLAAFDWS